MRIEEFFRGVLQMNKLTDKEIITKGVSKGIVDGPHTMAISFEFKRHKYLYRVCGRMSLHYAALRPPLPPYGHEIDISKL
jgi:hypothetical protein